MIKWDLSQGCKIFILHINIHKSINVIHHINKLGAGRSSLRSADPDNRRGGSPGGSEGGGGVEMEMRMDPPVP